METTHSEPKRRRSRPWTNILRIFQWKSSAPDSTDNQGRSSSSMKRRSSTVLSNRFNQRSKAAVDESQSNTGGSEEVASFPESQVSTTEIVKTSPVVHKNAQNSVSSSAIPISHLAELRAALRRRRSADECEDEDLGLPPSPAGTSMSPSDILSDLTARGNITQSTGSDASLLSMDSCENEEELSTSLVSGSSSAGLVLQERIQTPKEGQSVGEVTDGDCSLSHSAARHRISVKPRRTHALPRHRRLQQLSANTGGLPATPEVNEDISATAAAAVGTREAAQQQSALEKKPDRGLEPQTATEPQLRSSDLKPQNTVTPDKPQPGSPDPSPVTVTASKPRSGSSVPDSVTVTPGKPDPTSSASSSKLARSKSSVEKKIQYEVVNFWRRTRDKESSSNTEGSPQGYSSPSATPGSKRKEKNDSKKKKSKEKKDLLDSSYDSSDSLASQPFLSRIFGSKRSSNRRKKDRHKICPEPEPLITKTETFTEDLKDPSSGSNLPAQQNKGFETIEIAPETILTSRNENSLQNDPEKLNLPLFSAPQHQKRVSSVRNTDPGTEDLSRKNLRSELSPHMSRHRIHITGLSPYQQRVARIGNSLDIDLDAEFDGVEQKEEQPRCKVESFSSVPEKNQPKVESGDLALDSGAGILEKSCSADEVFDEKSPTPIDAEKNLGNPDCAVPAKTKPRVGRAGKILEPATEVRDLQPRSSREVPEFLQVQLNKIEPKSVSNVVFDTERRSKDSSELSEEKNSSIDANISRLRSSNNRSFLGRSLSSPLERNESRPVIVHVRNGVLSLTDTPECVEDDPLPTKTNQRNPRFKDRLHSSLASRDKSPETHVTVPVKEIVIEEKIPEEERNPSIKDNGNTESISSSSKAKLRHRGNKEPVSTPAVTSTTSSVDQTSELLRVFARRSRKFSEEVNELHSLDNSPNSPASEGPNDVFQEICNLENSTPPTEDNENSKNIWKKLPTQKKLSKIHLQQAEDTILSNQHAQVAKPFVTRQSKVLDLVNNFQRLQVT